jgi:hypothetical protein
MGSGGDCGNGSQKERSEERDAHDFKSKNDEPGKNVRERCSLWNEVSLSTVI